MDAHAARRRQTAASGGERIGEQAQSYSRTRPLSPPQSPGSQGCDAVMHWLVTPWQLAPRAHCMHMNWHWA